LGHLKFLEFNRAKEAILVGYTETGMVLRQLFFSAAKT
jgi:hypothetical protein